MKKILYEVDGEKGVLITLDNKRYTLNPGDIPTACTWTPTTELEIIKENGHTIIKNLSSDECVTTLL